MTTQRCWQVTDEGGFLMHPDPIADLRTVDTPFSAEIADHLQTLSEQLPTMLTERTIRPVLDKLSIYDMASLVEQDGDFRLIERCFQLYSILANAYVWAEEDNPTKHIPAGVAVPLVQLAEIVERPPIVVYASTALSNWQRIDPDGPISAENMTIIQEIVAIPDEAWFHLIHVEIEQHSAEAFAGCRSAAEAAGNEDAASAISALAIVVSAFDRMIATFRRMPEKCRPEVYFHTLRPFLFGFDDIVFEGVEKFGGKPQTLPGETGAQSSIIPAVQTWLGLIHERGGLSDYLQTMRLHMPKPHRETLAAIDGLLLRSFVQQTDNAELRDAYNSTIDKIVEFRSQHLYFANAYIASKVKNPKGTGGTDFMRWLKRMRDESAEQKL